MPPMLGRVVTIPATSPVVMVSILAPSSTSTGGLVDATSPAYTLRAPSAAASVLVHVRVEATVAVITV